MYIEVADEILCEPKYVALFDMALKCFVGRNILRFIQDNYNILLC